MVGQSDRLNFLAKTIQKPLVRQQQQTWCKDCFKAMEGRINPLTAGVRGLGLNSDANGHQFEDWSYGMEAIYSRSDQDSDSRDQRRRHSRGHTRHLRRQRIENVSECFPHLPFCEMRMYFDEIRGDCGRTNPDCFIWYISSPNNERFTTS